MTSAVILVLGFSAVKGGAADSARAIGLPVPPFFTPSIGSGLSRADGPATAPEAAGPSAAQPRRSAPGTPSAYVTYTTTTGEVVTLGGPPASSARTAVVGPWFPAVDASGAPVPSTAPASPSDAPPQPDEPGTVPILWTPDPEPSGEPTPQPSTPDPSTPGPGPTATTSFDPTSAAPFPTPTPTTSGGTSSAALRFLPPALVDPLVVAFPEGESRISLDLSRDYILTLPRDRPLVNTLGLTIVGGRNVVVIGGTVDVRDGVAGVRRGMYLKDATPNGTTYVEGVRFLSSTTGALTEGIDIASPGARVVLQNIAITGALTGSYATNHADVVQAWAGPRVLLVDGLSASSRYQGFFLLPNQHDSSPVDDWSINRVSLSGVQSAYLLWRDGGTYAIRTQDVYLTGSRYTGGGLWPSASDWPDVTLGPAPETYGITAGFGYSSPGYR
ncbi:MAG: hypothetical protein AB7O74_02605 [Candidatus Nanopelagicales bacterium]